MTEYDVNQSICELEEQGYSILPFTIDFELINKAKAELSGNYNYASEHYNLNNRIENAWTFSPAVQAIACYPEIIKLLKIYFKTEPFPFQTLNFERGSSQRLHSDYYHFASSTDKEMVGVWVALEDIHPDSGPLEVCAGSHKLPYLFPEDFGCHVGNKSNPYEFYKKYEDYIESLQQKHQFERHTICLNKGQALIWHSNLLHGGSKISDQNRTRLSQVTHYFSRRNYYFSPITSKRSFWNKSFRLPYDISSGKRVIPFIQLFN